MRVMVVDDSVVFRSQLKNCLEHEKGIASVVTAAHGRIALERVEQDLGCDLIILDLEMPEMNGLEFLAEMRKRGHKQKVIVFAAPTREGASQVLDALRAGASDFVAKPHNAQSLDEALEGIKRELLPKILQFMRDKSKDQSSAQAPESRGTSTEKRPDSAVSQPRVPKQTAYPNIILETFKPRVVVIGSSTGGPTALEKIFSSFKGKSVNVPILIAQHMPPHFTEALAKRLEIVSGIPAAEGKHGEPIRAGRIYLAPGDFHMRILRLSENKKVVLGLDQNPKRNSVRPAVDFLFESAAFEYGATCAGFILTGMGEDGRDGAVAIKNAQGAIMIQDQESSVVWGMPGSVAAAGAFDAQGNLDECAHIMLQMVS